MSATLEDVTRDALDLAPRQRIALAGFLLEIAEQSPPPDVDDAWDEEVRARIRAIDAGLVHGIPYQQVLHEVEQRLVP